MPAKRTTASKTGKRTTKQTYRVQGKHAMAKIKEIIREGNARRITIVNSDGKTVMVLPLTVGVVGAILAPPLVVVGAIVALVSECSIIVEK